MAGHGDNGELTSNTVITPEGLISEHEWADRERVEAIWDKNEGQTYRNHEPDRRGHDDR